MNGRRPVNFHLQIRLPAHLTEWPFQIMSFPRPRLSPASWHISPVHETHPQLLGHSPPPPIPTLKIHWVPQSPLTLTNGTRFLSSCTDRFVLVTASDNTGEEGQHLPLPTPPTPAPCSPLRWWFLLCAKGKKTPVKPKLPAVSPPPGSQLQGSSPSQATYK